MLALLGGLGGFALTAASWKILPAIAPESIPRLAESRADRTVFVFALVLAIVNGILFGITPALRLAKEQGIALSGFGVRGAAPGRNDGVRSFLVVAEVAVSVILVVIGGQLVSSFVTLLRVDPGFEADHVLAAVVLPAPERYPDPSKRGVFYKRMLDSIRALPGVENAGTVDALPFSGENHGGSISSTKASPLIAEVDIAGGAYLQAMGIRLLAGRWFRDDEMSESNDSAIVNDLIAGRLMARR